MTRDGLSREGLMDPAFTRWNLRRLLVRHAQASGAHRSTSDRDRELDSRGLRQACSLGEWLRENGAQVDLVLCSTARRCKQTLELMGGGWFTGDIVMHPAIYGASAQRSLAIISESGTKADAVLLLGHNPAIAQIASALLDGHPDARHVAPGTLLVVGWSKTGEGTVAGEAELVARADP